MKTKKILLAILAIAMLMTTAACNDTPEDTPEPDAAIEEVDQTPNEETTEPEILPEPEVDEENPDETNSEETQAQEDETIEPDEEYEDEPEEEDGEDEPEVGDAGESDVVVIVADVDPELIGAWTSDINEFAYLFLADGTGVRGIYPDVEVFSWYIEDGYIKMTFAQGTETWGYAVIGSSVMFTSELLPGQVFMFSRAY